MYMEDTLSLLEILWEWKQLLKSGAGIFNPNYRLGTPLETQKMMMSKLDQIDD